MSKKSGNGRAGHTFFDGGKKQSTMQSIDEGPARAQSSESRFFKIFDCLLIYSSKFVVSFVLETP
jgi:hypothetical protein